jgi:hypothetical protein
MKGYQPMNEQAQAEHDLDRLHTAITQHFTPAADEEGATDVDALIAAIEQAGQQLDDYRARIASLNAVAAAGFKLRSGILCGEAITPWALTINAQESAQHVREFDTVYNALVADQ